MKKGLTVIWTAIFTAFTAGMGALCAHAAEQGTEQLARMARNNQIMDLVQKVSLWILIAGIALLVCWYAVKLILKRIHVPPEKKDKAEKEDDQE